MMIIRRYGGLHCHLVLRVEKVINELEEDGHIAVDTPSRHAMPLYTRLRGFSRAPDASFFAAIERRADVGRFYHAHFPGRGLPDYAWRLTTCNSLRQPARFSGYRRRCRHDMHAGRPQVRPLAVCTL